MYFTFCEKDGAWTVVNHMNSFYAAAEMMVHHALDTNTDISHYKIVYVLNEEDFGSNELASKKQAMMQSALCAREETTAAEAPVPSVEAIKNNIHDFIKSMINESHDISDQEILGFIQGIISSRNAQKQFEARMVRKMQNPPRGGDKKYAY